MKSDFSLFLYVLGGIFVALAGIFTIQHLQLEAGYSLSLGIAALAGATLRRRGALRKVLLAALVSAVLVALGAFYTHVTSFAFLFAVIVSAIAAALAVLDEKWREPEDKGRRTERMLLTAAGASAMIGVVWASYAYVLSPLGEDFLVRRLALTVTVLVLGLAALAIGAKRQNRYWLGSGIAYVGVAATKALTYDTLNTDGLLRIATFAASGLVLIGGATLVKKLSVQS